jgi:CRISPR-associated protein Cst2
MRNVKMVTGLVLIDAQASALNNAGIEPGRMAENKVIVKKVRKGREEYPYVSGQAFKRWWRDTIHQKYAWSVSPITREAKVAYTEANPIKYQEDDIFGYMLAPARGEEKGLVYRRIAPLKCTPLISLFGNVITDDFAVFARGPAEAEPVPYEQEFYSTILKGAFSLMISEVGLFSRGRAKDLPGESDAQEALKGKQKDRLSSTFTEAKSKQAIISPEEITLPENERKKRIKETLSALSDLSGGAKTTNYLTDVSPKFVIMAILGCANHIFMDTINIRDGKPFLDTDVLSEVAKDYKDKFLSPIFIGLRKGFLDEQEYNRVSQITKFVEISVNFGTPSEAISKLVEHIDKVNL